MQDNDWIRISNAQLRYYMHIQDPDILSDKNWAKLIKELQWIRKAESGEK